MKPILQQAIHIKSKPSYLMLSLLSVISIACCWILLALSLGTTIKLLTILLVSLLVILSSIYFILRDALLLLPWSWKVLDIDSKGQLSIGNQRGQQFRPVLADTTFVNAKLTILNFKREGLGLMLPPVILLASADNADALRRLRVWLHWALPNARSNVTQNQDDLLASD